MVHHKGHGRGWGRLIGLLPAVSLLTVLFLGALGFSVAQSLGYAPQYGVMSFPTNIYYVSLFKDPGFWQSLGLTFYYAITPTLIGLMISIGLSLLLAHKFPGKGAALFIYKIPMVVPYLVGVALVLILFANGGIFARILFALDIIDRPSDFPRLLQTAEGWGIMLVYLWKQVPFMTVVLYAHLLVLSREPEESALLLGANRVQILWHVTLPRLIPAIVSSSLIVFAFNFGAFEVPYILGAGYPKADL